MASKADCEKSIASVVNDTICAAGEPGHFVLQKYVFATGKWANVGGGKYFKTIDACVDALGSGSTTESVDELCLPYVYEGQPRDFFIRWQRDDWEAITANGEIGVKQYPTLQQCKNTLRSTAKGGAGEFGTLNIPQE